MKKATTITLLLVCSFVFGQKDDKLVFFPQSPEVQTFQKYIDQPVSLHNGTVDVSIPIYNLPIGKHITYPLSLSYNTSGIKVNEKSGSVGLGWSISNPGVIIRNTRGQADNIVSLQGAYEDLKNNIYNVSLIGDKRADDNVLYQRLSDDFEPDEYSVSFFGETFKLVFDGAIIGSNLEEKFVQIPITKNKVKARLNGGFILGWEITDPKGNVYYFGSEVNSGNTAIEIQNPSTIFSFGSPSSSESSPSSGTYATAWYLIKVSTPENSNEAQFIYKNKGQSTIPNLIGETSYACPRVFLGTYEENLTMMDLCATQSLPATSFSYSIENNEELLIDEILTPTTRVKFNHLGSRNDIIGSKSLSNIEVFGNNTALLKKVDFNYSYFLPIPYEVSDCAITKLQPTILNSFVSSQSTRLKLDSITEKFSGPDQTVSSTHTFDYESNYLPNTFSFAQDHWGYYNGKHDNCGLLPNLSLQIEVGNFLIGKNDRTTNENYSKYGVLNKIKYPTGGSVNFIYEKNSVSSFLNINENFISLNPYRTIDLTAEQSLDENNNIVHNDLDLTLEFPFDNMIELTLFEKEFNPEGRAYYNSLFIESTTDPNFVRRIFATGPNHRFAQLLKNHTYKITCTVDPGAFFDTIGNPYMPHYGFKMKVGYKDFNPENIVKMDGGGLRISQIEFKDSNNDVISKKEYDYHNSGVGINEPLYVDPYYIGIPGGEQYPIYKLYGLSQMPNRSSFSSNAYYHNVSVYRTNIIDGKKTKTDLQFTPISEAEGLTETFDPNSINPRVTFRIPLRYQLATWRIGKLKEQIDYDFNLITNIYDPIKKVEFKYDKIKDAYRRNIFGFRFEKRGTITELTSYWPIPHDVYNWEFYSLYSESFDKVYTKTYEFFKNGNSLFKETNYNYTSPNHDFLTKEETIFPDLSTSEISYQYADEKGNAYLTGKNMIGIPLETEVKKTANGITKTVSKTLTKYPTSETEAKTRITNNTENKDFPLPFEVLSKDLQTTTMEKQINYDFYDDKGNILQYTTKSGIPTAIVWGYNQTQPIAKIEGATYAQVSSLATAIINASNTDAAAVPNNDETPFLGMLDAFRTNTALAGYQITTYSYDPLIGIRSITPPSGIRELYIYDTANRLKEVRDINGVLLKENEYHYKQ